MSFLAGKVRDRYSIVGYETVLGYGSCRQPIAPETEWLPEKFDEWPGLKLEGREMDWIGNEQSIRFLLHPSIWKWSYWPEGSQSREKDQLAAAAKERARKEGR